MTSLGESRVAAAAVPGCQHVLAGGTRCQDAVATKKTSDRVILALSDGHGDEEYVHSDEGARIAVAVAIDVLDKMIDAAGPASFRGEDASSPIKRRIAFEWNRRVKHHAKMLANAGGAELFEGGVTGDWDLAVKPYGCTLLAFARWEDSTLWFRLGDGEALAADSTGARRMFAASDKSMGQATYSMSMRTCVEHMHVTMERRACELALLASDGVADQYDVEPSFEKEWGARILERIQTKGFTNMAMDLPRDLGTVARDGDDCSVALAWIPVNA
jgi:hypothetical protein